MQLVANSDGNLLAERGVGAVTYVDDEAFLTVAEGDEEFAHNLADAASSAPGANTLGRGPDKDC